jgi:catechol 2,3-dioxygenase-like lactoylglutathione lyase family enzyme
MELDTCHFEIHVHSLDAANDFYVGKLGFEVLQHAPAIGLLAVQVGRTRISIFADALQTEVGASVRAGGHIIYRTLDLEATIDALRNVGIEVPEKISEAPGFMKYISIRDPSGNLLEIAQYLRDPLGKV